jgi:hypothetical protein
MAMVTQFEQAARWRDNRRAFQAALADLQETAVAVGLALRQADDVIDGWPHVLRAEVRQDGGPRVLASLDVGLSETGLMLLQTSPGEARVFSRFQPRDRAFYLRQFCDLIETAMQHGAHGAPSAAQAVGRSRTLATSWARVATPVLR